MFQKTGIFFIKLPMYQSFNLLYARNISLKKHLSHINKVSSIYEIYLTIKLYTIFNFIKVCRSNLDFLLYHPLGTFFFCVMPSSCNHTIWIILRWWEEKEIPLYHFNAEFLQKLYGSLKTLIFSVSLVFLTLLHAITMDLDKYTIIKLHNSFIPPIKMYLCTVLKLVKLKSTQTNLYTCNFKLLKTNRY